MKLMWAAFYVLLFQEQSNVKGSGIWFSSNSYNDENRECNTSNNLIDY